MSALDWLNLAAWSVVWTIASTIVLPVVYLSWFEPRYGRPSRLHRYLLLLLCGPLLWLIALWDFIEPDESEDRELFREGER